MKKYLFLLVVLLIFGCKQNQAKSTSDIKPIIPEGFLNNVPFFHIHILKNKIFYVDGKLGNIEMLKSIIKFQKADLDSVSLYALLTYENNAIITKEISDLLWNKYVLTENCKINSALNFAN